MRGRGKKKSITTFILSKSSSDSRLEKAIKYIRGNFLIPDAKIGWQKYLVKSGLEIIKKEKIDLIFSSSPPHSLQLGARKLAKISKLKWVADFRDPWTTIGYHKQLKLSKKAKLKHKDLEKQVLNSADQIIVTSPTTKKEFEKLKKVTDELKTMVALMKSEEKSETPLDRKSTRLNSSHVALSRMPSSA